MAAAVLVIAALPRPAAAAPSPSADRRQLLDTYCIACHNARLETAGLVLESAAVDASDVAANTALWEKVLRKVRSGQMPPAGRPRPAVAAAGRFARELASTLDAVAAAAPDPGRPAVHRLNRTEYVNAVRDLLALEIDGRVLLPADDSGFGFDNNADVLTMSPALLDRYLAAATRIARLAVGDPALRPAVAKYDAPRAARQQERTSEALPFGTRGGLSVRHTFPLDGEYLIKVRLRRDGDYGIAGLDRGDRLEIRLDRRRIATFTVGGDAELRGLTYDSQEPIPPDRPDLLRRKIYDNTADEGLEVRLPVPAGTRRVGAAFARYAGVAEAGGRLNRAPAVESVEILGPYDASPPAATPSRERIFTCRPARPEEETRCAREILSALARRAFRRPVAAADIDVLLQFHAAGRAAGTFDSGIQAALERLLVDPEFLFRIEHDPPGLAAGTVHALSDLELASRLSFFLWSSLPDDELLDVAAAGRLREPGVLPAQIGRLLADRRSDAFIDNFFGQWLLLRNLRTAAPDPDAFPDFDENLREALQQETALFVASQVREDRSVLDLLRADYTFLNERLARHYGVANVYGNHFRRVNVAGRRRGGLLGQGSVLTATSYPNRTSPTKRGLWVLESLLGSAPPPPPAEVPGLPDADHPRQDRRLSMRERMEIHRISPVCASCHVLMDPLGFALENYDGIGAWRTTEDGAPIDVASRLPDGSRFAGPHGLRDILLGAEERFVETVAEKLLTYALGRGIEYYDAPAVRGVARGAADNDYRWTSMVLGVVESTPFQMRRSREP